MASILSGPIKCKVVSEEDGSVAGDKRRSVSLSTEEGSAIVIESSLLYDEQINVGDVFTLFLVRGSVRPSPAPKGAIAEKVKQIFVDELGESSAPLVTLDAKLDEDLAVDELDLDQIIIAIEDHFQISISTEQTKTIKTVGDAVRVVEGCLVDEEAAEKQWRKIVTN
jgi:acyl carrier protein